MKLTVAQVIATLRLSDKCRLNPVSRIPCCLEEILRHGSGLAWLLKHWYPASTPRSRGTTDWD